MSGLTFDMVDELIRTDEEHPEWRQSLEAQDTAPIRQAVLARFDHSTVLRQYIGHLNRRDILPRNRFGWHAEGERLYAAYLMASNGDHGVSVVDADGNPQPHTMAMGLTVNALLAQVYLWSDEIEALADATPLPKHVISRDVLPYPVMFWSRETAHTGPGWETNWLLVMHSAHGIRTAADVVFGPNDCRITLGDIPYGRTFPDDFPEQIRDGVGAILGRLAFLASPYIAPVTERVPRAWRREEAKAGIATAPADPIIRVVKLRREVEENVRRQREDVAHPTERRSHWWVSGHHRAQWYPSKEAHEVIWIAPHLKGDLSKPLAQKVYKVTR